jgi:hypothetical protein
MAFYNAHPTLHSWPEDGNDQKEHSVTWVERDCYDVFSLLQPLPMPSGISVDVSLLRDSAPTFPLSLQPAHPEDAVRGAEPGVVGAVLWDEPGRNIRQSCVFTSQHMFPSLIF